VPRVVGEAGLAAEEAVVLVEQLVVVVDLEARPAAVPREVHLLGLRSGRELVVLHRGAEDQAHVVRGRRHAGAVQAGRGRGPRVERAHLLGQRVHLARRGVRAAERAGQGVRGVVAGPHHQCVQQLVDRVLAARADADPRALLVRVLLRARDDLVRAQLTDDDDGQQDLDQRRRTLPGVRVLGGEHVAGLEVGNYPCGGRHSGRRGAALGLDEATFTHPCTPDRVVRYWEWFWARSAWFRLLRRVDRRRRDLLMLAGALRGVVVPGARLPLACVACGNGTRGGDDCGDDQGA